MTAQRWVSRALAVPVVAALAFAVAACSSAVPYTDQDSAGEVALCTTDGKLVTTGKVSDKPFVWKAVGLVKATGRYAGNGRKATLVAFQPREHATADQWDGSLLTTAKAYANPDHPTVAATGQDLSLAEYLRLHPATWEGLVQLRIYLGAPGMPTLSSKYATADLKIEGDTWKVVRGAPSGEGGDACSSVSSGR